MSDFTALLTRTRNRYYNCGDFVVEAYAVIYGRRLPESVIKALSSDTTETILHAKNDIHVLDGPEEGALVSFWRIAGRAHIGLFHKGRVLHLAGDMPQHIPLAILRGHYPVTRFYGVS